MKVELDDVLAFIELYKKDQTYSKYTLASECRELQAALERLALHMKIKFEKSES